MTLGERLKAAHNSEAKAPLWRGPEKDGITFSLLSRFLVCRERFRVLVVDGLRPRDDFNHRMEYGTMWHVCEEAAGVHENVDWMDRLTGYCGYLCERYPLRQADILKWTQVCAAQFPAYVNYYATHSDAAGTNLLRERSFDVSYQLPSGRTVRLRGKWDSVDFLPAHEDAGRSYSDGIWLQENKTKGDIDPAAIRQQLRFDLQTMIYLVALGEEAKNTHPDAFGAYSVGELIDNRPILGVRYNVIRRPLSGGRHTIVQHKATRNKMGESEDEYYARLAGLISGEPEYFFMRWKCEVSAADVDRFRRVCLDPILEQLCDWWEWVSRASDPFDPDTMAILHGQRGCHFLFPYGVYNPLTDGGTSDVDEYVTTGSLAGLRKTDNLFPELS